MNLINFFAAVAFVLTVALPAYGQDAEASELHYTDGHEFSVIGKFHNERTYVRFPARYESKLRTAVWNLGRNSAGVSILFRTNSRVINVRWSLTSDNLALPHMPATGVSGVDLYGYTDKEGWQYIKTGFPRDTINEATLLTGGDGVTRDYLLNLPLYNGVSSVAIGVEGDAVITQSQHVLANQKPVVYYGTSIAQGACASRPGMAYTHILSRKFGRPFINLGFSGNGTMETSVGEAMAETDAALFVLDCMPNTPPEVVYDRTLALVKLLKERRPATPILLVERFDFNNDIFSTEHIRQTVLKKNAELKRAFETLHSAGVIGLHYLQGNGLFGQDHEGTVDGIHPNDLGMTRMSEALAPIIEELL